MRWILLFLGVGCLVSLPARAGHSPPNVIFRVFIQTSGEGLPDTQAREITVPPDNQAIQIRALPEITEAELQEVHTDPSGNVHVVLNHAGQVDLDAATAQNQGRIMVVMIDGYIVYAPLIDEQISNGELVIPHPLTPLIIQLLEETAQRNDAQARRA